MSNLCYLFILLSSYGKDNQLKSWMRGDIGICVLFGVFWVGFQFLAILFVANLTDLFVIVENEELFTLLGRFETLFKERFGYVILTGVLIVDLLSNIAIKAKNNLFNGSGSKNIILGCISGVLLLLCSIVVYLKIDSIKLILSFFFCYTVSLIGLKACLYYREAVVLTNDRIPTQVVG